MELEYSEHILFQDAMKKEEINFSYAKLIM